VWLRFYPDEFEKLSESEKKTTCSDLSDYLRRVLLNKPITGYIRNKSLDEFTEEMMLLRKELNHIGNNFNQAVKKLHTCDT
jgi:argonaute-like protein implicated in RNA metabolism and viral defense